MARTGNLRNRLYAELRSRIESGRFPVGICLPTEAKLCEEFEVSRSSIRASMEMLRAEGLIKTVRGSGSFVLKGGREREKTSVLDGYEINGISDILQCLEMRMLVEGDMAALAAERWIDADMKAIEKALQAVHPTETHILGTVEEDLEFHRSIVKAAKNEYGLRLYDAMSPHILFGMRLVRGIYDLLPEAAIRNGLKEHTDIFEAVRARDSDTARAVVHAHINFFRNDLMKKLPY